MSNRIFPPVKTLFSPRPSTIKFWVIGQKPPDKRPPDKSLPKISPRYKSPKKPGAGYLFLGLVDPSRNRLASTAYFAIIFSIILRGLLSGAFVRVAYCGKFFAGYHILYAVATFTSSTTLSHLHKQISHSLRSF